MTAANLLDVMRKLKHLITSLAASRIAAYFVKSFNEEYPRETLNGRKIASIEDVILLFTSYMGRWDEKWREKAFFALHKVWKGYWPIQIEAEIMLLLEMKYSPTRLFDRELLNKRAQRSGRSLPTRPKNHKGDFVKDIIVEKKGSMMCPIKLAIEKYHHELYYVRFIPTRPKKEVVQIRRVFKYNFGFPGYLGLTQGHPLAMKDPNNGTVVYKREGWKTMGEIDYYHDPKIGRRTADWMIAMKKKPLSRTKRDRYVLAYHDFCQIWGTPDEYASSDEEADPEDDYPISNPYHVLPSLPASPDCSPMKISPVAGLQDGLTPLDPSVSLH